MRAAPSGHHRFDGALFHATRTLGTPMNLTEVRLKLKELIVSELNLEGKTPADIDDAAPLFGEGLGLDSLDALQLAMSIEEAFGVRIPEGEQARSIFASINAIAEHIVVVKATA